MALTANQPDLAFLKLSKDGEKYEFFMKSTEVASFSLQNTKNKTAVKLTAVSCAPVVEVKIKRPDTKYQLGFSVQNGVVSVPLILPIRM